MVLRMTVGLVLTVVALGDRGAPAVVAEAAGVDRAAGAGADRGGPVASGPGCGDPGDRGGGAAQAAEVDGAGRGARGDVLGFHRAVADDHRGLWRLVFPDVRDPGIGHWAFIGFIEDLFASACWPGSSRSP